MLDAFLQRPGICTLCHPLKRLRISNFVPFRIPGSGYATLMASPRRAHLFRPLIALGVWTGPALRVLTFVTAFNFRTWKMVHHCWLQTLLVICTILIRIVHDHFIGHFSTTPPLTNMGAAVMSRDPFTNLSLAHVFTMTFSYKETWCFKSPRTTVKAVQKHSRICLYVHCFSTRNSRGHWKSPRPISSRTRVSLARHDMLVVI
jgi:hypothetical protein